MTAIETTAALADAVTGPVLRPSDPGYGEELAGFNLATTHTPEFIVAASCAGDIVATMRWATERNLPVAVQATGHGANIAVDRGVLISTRQMDSVEIDPQAQTATVGAGVRWQAVLNAAAPHGLAGLSGSSSDVGVVGYAVGGGLPVLGRAFGFAADRVRGFEVVTGDGNLRHVDAECEPELYWALRGGKGNVGIVTSLVCGLVALTRIYGGSIFYAGEHAPALLAAYRDWVCSVPDTMCTAFTFLRLPPLPAVPEPLRGQFVVQLCVAFVGEAAEGEALLAPMRAAAPTLIDTVVEMDYPEIDRVYQDPDHPVPAKEGCTLLRELTPAAVDTLLRHAGPGAQTPLVIIQLQHLGGALARSNGTPVAAAARDAQFCLSVIGMLAPQVAHLVPAAVQEMVTVMEPYSTGRSFVNLHGTPGDEADRARAWSVDTYRRLRADKARYDPANLLRFGHAIGTALTSGAR